MLGAQRALEVARAGNCFAPLFNPPTHVGNEQGAGPARVCPGGTGGTNITGPAVADPVAGVMFVTSHSGCGRLSVAPAIGSNLDGNHQMNTGEYLWVIPNGDAPEAQQEMLRNHPLLQGVPNAPTNPGRGGHAVMTVIPNLLLASGQTSDNTRKLFAIDKRTGERSRPPAGSAAGSAVSAGRRRIPRTPRRTRR